MFGDLDGRDITRKSERAPQRDETVVFVLVVLRRPRLIVERPGRRGVVHERRRRDVGPPGVGGGLERREVDERLEDRSWLTPRRDGAVVLGLVVRAAADEGDDVAAARIDGDERRLRAPLAAAPREQFVHADQAAADGVLRDPLQVQVQRRVHVDGLVGRGGEAGVVLVDRLRDVVDEVRRFSFERPLNDDEWLP